jgi:hypothetical protein
VQPLRLDRLWGKELKEALAGRDGAATVVTYIDDEPVLGELAHDTRDLSDKPIDLHQPIQTHEERPDPYVAKFAMRRAHRPELQFVRKRADIRHSRVWDGLPQLKAASGLEGRGDLPLEIHGLGCKEHLSSAANALGLYIDAQSSREGIFRRIWIHRGGRRIGL